VPKSSQLQLWPAEHQQGEETARQQQQQPAAASNSQQQPAASGNRGDNSTFINCCGTSGGTAAFPLLIRGDLMCLGATAF